MIFMENQNENIRLYLTDKCNLYSADQSNRLLDEERKDYFLTLLENDQKLGTFTPQFYLKGDKVTPRPDPDLGHAERIGQVEVIIKSINTPKQDVDRIVETFKLKVTSYDDSLKRIEDNYQEAVKKATEEGQRALEALGSRPSLDSLLIRGLFQ